ncbi:MAG: NADPH-dependent FMN reductase [Candidatus Woesearchaeota archaeon]
MKFLIFYGSYRSDRIGIDVAQYVKDSIINREHDADIIDAKEYDFGFLNKMYKEFEGDAPEKMETLARMIDDADGFILISGEYNHSIQPGLSNLLDHFQKEYLYKPSGIVGYSPSDFGGARSAMQMRTFMPEIGSITIPSILYVPEAHLLKDKLSDENERAKLEDRTRRFLDEFFWYADALKNKRESSSKQ